MRRAQAISLIWRLNLTALWALIATVSVIAGLTLRDWTWKTSAPIRFYGDVGNALNVGRTTVLGAIAFQYGKTPEPPGWAGLWKSYLGRYDAEYNRFSPQPDGQPVPSRRYSIDYPPGRLLIASAWAMHITREVPPGQTRPRGMVSGYDDAFATPLRDINIGHEFAAALATFFLTRRILLNANRRLFASEALAMLAALLVWFNPALILNAHGWPQWEAWVLPYTLWAAYFALIDCWLFAGVLIAVGAMLKGQVLLFMPILPLWALFAWRWGALLRLASGFFAAAALLLSPWLLRDALPAIWVVGGTLAFALSLILLRRRGSRLSPVALAALAGWIASPLLATAVHPRLLIASGIATFLAAALLLILPRRAIWTFPILAVCMLCLTAILPTSLGHWINAAPPRWLSIAMPRWRFSNDFAFDSGTVKIVFGVLCAIGGVALLARRRFALPATVAAFAALAFLAALAFNGSFAWLHVGFQTERYDTLFMGRVSNLPAILAEFYNLGVDTPVSNFGCFSTPILLSPLLKAIAGIGLALCALSFSIQTRRKDPNALIAFAAAWTLLYALLPQMHERYLTWGAVVSAMLVARGIGGLLVHLTLTAIQFAMLIFAMSSSHGRGEQFIALAWWTDVFRGMQPAIGYVVLTLAIVMVVWSFRRSVPKQVVIRRAAAPRLLPRAAASVVPKSQLTKVPA